MRKSNFVLRLQPSLLEEARQLVSALRTEKYFAECAARANVPKALAIVKRSGVGNPPMRGDKRRRLKKRA